MAVASSPAAVVATLGAACGCAVTRPRQLSSSAATTARVGVPLRVGGQHGAMAHPPERQLGVRCQGIPFFTKRKAVAKEEVEDVVGTVQVLKEGAFDVGCHMVSELLGQKVKLYLVSTELHPVHLRRVGSDDVQAE